MRKLALLAVCLIMCVPIAACREGIPVINVPSSTSAPVFVTPRPASGEQELFLPVPTAQPPLPQSTLSRQWTAVYGLIYEPLVRLDASGTPVPGICESFTPSADGKTWTFKIRLGVLFHDGMPLNAQAVADSFGKMKAGNNPYTALLNKIERVKAEDELVLTVVSKEAGWDAVYAMTAPVIGADNGPLPAGTGIYRVTVLQGESLYLEANADSWRRPPAIPYARTVVVSGEEASLGRLAMGEISLAPLYKLAPGAVDRAVADTAVIATQQYEMMVFNQRANSSVNDLRVRQALCALIDDQTLARLQHVGGALMSDLPVLPGNHLFNAQLAKAALTREEAVSLLEEAGYSQGYPLRLRLLTNTETESAPRADIAKAIQEMLAPHNVNVEITALPFTDFLASAKQGAFDAALIGVTLPIEPDLRPLLMTGGANNITGSSDSELDGLLTDASVVVTAEERAMAWSALEKYLLEQLPFAGFYFHTGTLAYTRGLAGVETAREPWVYDGVSGWRFER